MRPQISGTRLRRILVLLPCLFPAAVLVRGAPSEPSTEAITGQYEFRQQRSADGIGKFYLGREIAHIMGHQSADWLERPEREEEEHSERLVEELKLQPGQVAADIGAGTGYFSRRLARKVGREGKVLAVDIQPEMLQLLTNRMARFGIANVIPILGTPTNPCLPAASVDLALLVDVYHEFDFPSEMMRGICDSLRPGGRVVFVEFRAEDPQVPIKPLHKMSVPQLLKEMAAQPLSCIETNEVLPWQHILIFKKSSASERRPLSVDKR